AGARTVNIGYALRGLMNLPRGEEADTPDQRDDRDYEPQKKPPASDDAEAIDQLGKNLVGRCAALDFAEWKEIDGRKRLAKVAAECGVKLTKNITLADLQKVERHLTKKIESHPACVKVEQETAE